MVEAFNQEDKGIDVLDWLEKSIIETLYSLVDKNEIDSEDGDSFVRTMNMIYRFLNVNQKELSFAMSVTESTTCRWLSGKVLPYKHERKEILLSAILLAKRKLNAKG